MGEIPLILIPSTTETMNMLQIISNPKHTYLNSSTAAIAALVIAVTAFLGRVYHLIEPGPSSWTSKLFLLAMALFAFSIASDEVRQDDGSQDRPIVAMVAQRIGFIQTALGGALMAVAIL